MFVWQPLPMYKLIRKSGQFRVMVQGVNAVKSEVPMPQFTATLRNLCFSPDVTARDNLCAHDVVLFDYYI